MLRTHTCGELDKKQVKKEVSLSGWVQSNRDHGGIVFIDLRDKYGITQVVFDPSENKKAHAEAEKLRREDVIKVSGKVRLRGEGLVNKKIPTGEIEVLVDEFELLNKSETPPLEVADNKVASDDLRLKYRYIDLRRPIMQKHLSIRHKAAMAARTFFDSEGFTEIETPLLIKHTPEGARDFVVPSRVHPGYFYSLPQSPQIYKQILMVSGVDKYFQFAKCMRDEDNRIDRQPEFTQIDLEMSFVEQDDVFNVVEGVMKSMWNVAGIKLKTPFLRMRYDEAMARYGIDRPDTRFGLELIDVTDVVKKSDFGVFTKNIDEGGVVKCLNPKHDFSRKELDALVTRAQRLGAKGMAWMKVTKEGVESSITKYFEPSVLKALLKKTEAKPGSYLLFIADKPTMTHKVLAALRLELGEKLNLIDESKLNFLWIIDFPMFEWDEENESWTPAHHIFTMPKREHLEYLKTNPEKVYAQLYDLVLNGLELGSGSIRINRPDIQEQVLEVIGMSKSLANKKFGYLLESFKYGAPPHGGIGLGYDRIMSLMNGTQDIREVIAFPKNKSLQCPMDGSPSMIDATQLDELHIKVDTKKGRNKVLADIQSMLREEKAPFEIMEHKPVFTSKEAARERGTTLEQGMKSLIVKVGKEFVNAIVPGNKNLDLKKLKSVTNAKVIEMADASEVRTVTGCNIGSVPPFGNLFDLKVYVDKKTAEQDMVAFNAGTHTTSIMLKWESYKRVVNPKIVDISK